MLAVALPERLGLHLLVFIRFAALDHGQEDLAERGRQGVERLRADLAEEQFVVRGRVHLDRLLRRHIPQKVAALAFQALLLAVGDDHASLPRTVGVLAVFVHHIGLLVVEEDVLALALAFQKVVQLLEVGRLPKSFLDHRGGHLGGRAGGELEDLFKCRVNFRFKCNCKVSVEFKFILRKFENKNASISYDPNPATYPAV